MEELVHLTELTALPLSSNQKRLWIISQIDGLNPAYNLGHTYYLKGGDLNLSLFQESINILFNRHNSIFSVFKQKDHNPYCEIIRRQINIDPLDFSNDIPEIAKEKILLFISEDLRKPFNIETGPLYRLYLLKQDDSNFYFHLTIHHIIFDGWSWGVFVRDFNRIYNQLTLKQEQKLEPLNFQSYDYASWERNSGLLKNEEESVKFWKENLKDSPSELKFPYDHSRKNIPTGLGEREYILIPANSTSILKRISQEGNTSLFRTILSALGILFQKYSGDNDICLGTYIANRSETGMENIFGMFVDTVIIRFRINEDDTFSKFLNYSKNVIHEAITHKDLPFERIVNEVKPNRISGMNPIFQVSLSWLTNFITPMELRETTGERVIIKDCVSPFDITFYLWESGDIVEGEIEYNIDILKRDTIIRVKNNFLKLINSLVQNSDTPIKSLPMISDEERMMIDSVNNTLTNFSKDKTIIQLFEERAILNTERIAIVFNDGELTYSELNVKANHLAGVLQTYNIGQGDFVGLLLKRSPELIICLLAILKTGAAYVPLNLTDPESRILSTIDAAKIKFVITNNGYDIDLTGNHKRLNIEQLINQSENLQVEYKNTLLKSTDPAYIIFTSGTTGTPKGVLVNHKSVINIIEWVNKTFKISNNDKLLWVTNLSFDLSVYDIFGILAAGGTIRIISEEDRLDPEKQYDLLLNEGITFWDSAPQSLQQLTPFFNRKGNQHLYNSLRLVFLSGDWIPLSLPTTVTSIFPSAVIVGLGGATEATIWSNYFIIDKVNPEWKSIPYGKPIQNARYYILDEKMDHCRIRQPGNLYIGGDCLALGYYNDTVLSNSKFIPDPYNPGSKLYLTGDKAQWMADGNIEFLGRVDEQIKIRGYRVEMGEIKNVALQNKSIKEAIVIPDKSDRHNVKVLLFITTYDNRKLEVTDLKRKFREYLPEYMIPADIIQYSEFPVTINGKIDTKALLSYYFISLIDKQTKDLTDEHREDSATLTSTEKLIHNIWSDALKIKDISVTDNFFDIGGNSLLAISVFSKIESAFNVKLGLRIFFDNTRIRDLAETIDIIKSKSFEQKFFGIKEKSDSKIIEGEI